MAAEDEGRRGLSDELRTLLNVKAAQRHEAQDKGDQMLGECAQKLSEYFNYQITRISRTIKKRSRIFGKALEELAEHPECSSIQVCDTITDIAGGRLLVIGVGDIYTAESQLQEIISAISWADLSAERRVTISDPRPGGFRGLARIAYLTAGALNNYPFEIQVMTHLQHAWDQLQHPLYEEARKQGGAVEAELNVEFEKLSEQLYDLDQNISELQAKFQL